MKILLLLFFFASFAEKNIDRSCTYLGSIQKFAHELVKLECNEELSYSSGGRTKYSLSCIGPGNLFIRLWKRTWLNFLWLKKAFDIKYFSTILCGPTILCLRENQGPVSRFFEKLDRWFLFIFFLKRKLLFFEKILLKADLKICNRW